MNIFRDGSKETERPNHKTDPNTGAGGLIITSRAMLSPKANSKVNTSNDTLIHQQNTSRYLKEAKLSNAFKKDMLSSKDIIISKPIAETQ